MSNNRIFKYQLQPKLAYTVDLPIGTQILALGVQAASSPSGPAAFPLWDVTVVDKRDNDEEQHLQFTAQNVELARAHFEDLGYIVNSVELIAAAAKPSNPSYHDTQVIWAKVPFVCTDGDPIAHPAPTVVVRFLSLPTGAELPEGNWLYVGALQLQGQVGEAVFHVFVDGTYVTVA